jgi:imidazolonepropionase-like amidohydrolase
MEGLLGEIVAGAYADIIFLKENPLENVTSFHRTDQNLMAIIKDGSVVKSCVLSLSVERSVDWN